MAEKKQDDWSKNLYNAENLHKYPERLAEQQAKMRELIKDVEDKKEKTRARRYTSDETGYAKGGVVKGRGSKDTVKARLTPGEFVVTKNAAKGRTKALSRLNKGMGGGGPIRFARST